MIRIECPSCRAKYTVEAHTVGRTARCACGDRFRIEEPASLQPAGEPAAPPQGQRVFVSYASQDKDAADALWQCFGDAEVSAWMAPQSIPPGSNYGEAIIAAISSSELLVLVFSRATAESGQVRLEVERAVSKGKKVIPVRIEDAPLSGALEYFLSSSQWFDAFEGPRSGHFRQLARMLKDQLGAMAETASTPEQCVAASVDNREERWSRELRAGKLAASVAGSDAETLRTIARLAIAELDGRGFSKADGQAVRVVLRELVQNVQRHVDEHAVAEVTLTITTSRLELTVADEGQGFDFDAVKRDLASRISEGERERGIFRAIRYGTTLDQAHSPRHTMVWARLKRPETLASVFDGYTNVICVVFDYDTELVRVADDIYWIEEIVGFQQIMGYLRPLFPLRLEPLRRRQAPVIGAEVRGTHHTIAGAGAPEFIKMLWHYRTATVPDKTLILFADTEQEDHHAFATFRESVLDDPSLTAKFLFFEDLDECRQHLK